MGGHGRFFGSGKNIFLQNSRLFRVASPRLSFSGHFFMKRAELPVKCLFSLGSSGVAGHQVSVHVLQLFSQGVDFVLKFYNIKSLTAKI